MSKNRFFTIIIVPEKTSKIRRYILPSWAIKVGIIGFIFLVALSSIMIMDYTYVMSQISENKALKMDNRRLKQKVQVFENRINTIESTFDRVKTFVTRLKVITNIEDRGQLLESLNGPLPDSKTNLGESAPKTIPSVSEEPLSDIALTSYSAGDPEGEVMRNEFNKINERFSGLQQESLKVELTLQDLYELLADQKSFLAALPTRKPAIGYFTSGFGVRHSPFDGRAKMHEGLDIANFPGTQIKATADGVIAFSDAKTGYGQTVIIDHGYGLESWFGHCRKIITRKGARVHRGETIALMGSSGRSTGSHVHYEVRVNGIPVDPLSYILEN